MTVTLDFRKPHLLRDEMEYSAALEEIERLLELDPEPYPEEYERLEFLSLLVERYEDEVYPIDNADPREAVDFMLEQKDMARADLADLLGGKSRVSEFFSGKRRLSLGQVRALSEALGIPADILIRE